MFPQRTLFDPRISVPLMKSLLCPESFEFRSKPFSHFVNLWPIRRICGDTGDGDCRRQTVDERFLKRIDTHSKPETQSRKYVSKNFFWYAMLVSERGVVVNNSSFRLNILFGVAATIFALGNRRRSSLLLRSKSADIKYKVMQCRVSPKHLQLALFSVFLF